MSAVVPPPSREPKPGEKCVCGRPAVKVWLQSPRLPGFAQGEVPFCGNAGKPVKQ